MTVQFSRRLAAIAFLALLLLLAGQRAYGNSWEPPGRGEVTGLAGLIRAALLVFAAEHGGTLMEFSGGIGPIRYAELDLEESEFNTRWMNAADFTLIALDKPAGTFTIQAGPSTVAGGATGIYQLTSEMDVPEDSLGGFNQQPRGCGSCTILR